jgi:hypothetical protein
MGAFEQLVGERLHEKLFAKSTLILKQLYDEDILDEETILEWSHKESKKYVAKAMSRQIHEKVGPLVKWLREAEVESAESSSEDGEDMASKSSNSKTPSLDIEDEEDGIELEFTHRAADKLEVKVEKASVATINPALVTGGVVVEQLDDDVIDDI